MLLKLPMKNEFAVAVRLLQGCYKLIIFTET
jgi:hypothetical protein